MDPRPGVAWSSIVKNSAPPKQRTANAKQFLECCQSKQGIAVIVVDASAIIQGGDQLPKLADRIVSISEVLEEVRDPVSRHLLQAMPVQVDIMDPDPDFLRKVINFARATGDLQTLSDTDLKLIALAYTLESQLHGTKNLRESPPPIQMVSVKRLPEIKMPGWGCNVPNLAEWEALEHAVDTDSSVHSRILPLKDLTVNSLTVNSDESSSDEIQDKIQDDQQENEDNFARRPQNCQDNGNCFVSRSQNHQEDGDDIVNKPPRHQADGDVFVSRPQKFISQQEETKKKGRNMVIDGIDASLGEGQYNTSEWHLAISRRSHKRSLRQKAKSKLVEVLEKLDHAHKVEEHAHTVSGHANQSNIAASHGGNEILKGKSDGGMAVDASAVPLSEEEVLGVPVGDLGPHDGLTARTCSVNENNSEAGDGVEKATSDFDNLKIESQVGLSIDSSLADDNSSEQSWMHQPLSDSSVACMTSDFSMQNVILQIGLRLLAPGGMQIRQVNRWVLRCHACNEVTAEIGRIFCPRCGNGGTLCKVSVMVGENGIIVAGRRSRAVLRGTKFSLPLPRGGRDAITKNPILREDQLPPRMLYPKVKKSYKQGFEVSISDEIFSRCTHKKPPLTPPIRKAMALFYGRRNPNDNHFSRSRR